MFSPTRLKIPLLLALIVALAASGGWYYWRSSDVPGDKNYWQLWAAGKLAGEPDQSRLIKGFEATFRNGDRAADHQKMLATAHFVNHFNKNQDQFQWNDNSSMRSDGEGTMIFSVIVDKDTGLLTKGEWGIITE